MSRAQGKKTLMDMLGWDAGRASDLQLKKREFDWGKYYLFRIKRHGTCYAPKQNHLVIGVASARGRKR